MSKYSLAIQRLEPIIEHWFDKEELKKHLKDESDGLCFNLCWHYVAAYSDSILFDCIIDYAKHNKLDVDENRDLLWFPVEGNDVDYRAGSDNLTLYNNPKRLHFAVFMLQWLKSNNV